MFLLKIFALNSGFFREFAYSKSSCSSILVSHVVLCMYDDCRFGRKNSSLC